MAAVMSACDVLGSDVGVVAIILCGALATTLLALIALGFGPLRGWLTPTDSRRSPDERVAWRERGLPGTWRLYRQLRSAAPPRR